MFERSLNGFTEHALNSQPLCIMAFTLRREYFNNCLPHSWTICFHSRSDVMSATAYLHIQPILDLILAAGGRMFEMRKWEKKVVYSNFTAVNLFGFFMIR